MIVFGKNVAKEVIDSKKEIKKVYFSKQYDDEKLIKYFEENNIKINRMDKRILDQKFKGNNQGIALEIEDYKYLGIDDVLDAKFLVMLDHLEDPHNFGAIIRTAEAAGIKSIIIPKDRSVKVNGTAVFTRYTVNSNTIMTKLFAILDAMDMNNNHDYVQSKTETTINSNVSLQQVETNIQDIASRLPVEDIKQLKGDK